MKKVIFLLVVLLFAGCSFFPEDESYMVEVRTDNGVSVSPQSATLEPGEKITFRYTLKEGYVLKGILINGVSIAPDSNTFSVVASVPMQSIVVTTTEEEKQKFVISAIAGLNGIISPYGEVIVTKGQDQIFSIIPNTGFLVETFKIDDQVIASPDTSYTFSNVTSNKKIEVTFKKDSILWPLLNIEWNLDSIYVDDHKFSEIGQEVLNFYTEGRYTKLLDNVLYDKIGWAIDKNKTPSLLIYGGRSCEIEKINEQKLIFSYINADNQKVTHVYSNHRYK